MGTNVEKDTYAEVSRNNRQDLEGSLGPEAISERTEVSSISITDLFMRT